MKQMFFVLFLIVFVSSCEDEINSSNDDIPTNPGCTDVFALCNRDFDANVNDDSCIYVEEECVDFNSCEAISGEWSDHTCTNPEDDSNASSWDGDETTCNELSYTYTPGSCDTSDGGES